MLKMWPFAYTLPVGRPRQVRAEIHEKGNFVPTAFSLTIFKMADRREKTLAKAGSRDTKYPKILEIFIT